MTRVVVRGSVGPVDAVVRVPGSKSVANRALLCAALADAGRSVITNVPGGDDCEAMLDALRSAGCVAPDGAVLGGIFPGSPVGFSAGIAGTTSRFLTAAAALSREGIVIDGGEPLRRRPMADLHGALRALGAHVEDLGQPGHLPVRVARGALSGGSVRVRGDVSSQFVSALMLVGPRVDGGLVISVEGELVSRPYVEMTASVMRSFGATVAVDDSGISVAQGAYAACAYRVEPDFSSAAFPVMAMAFTEGSVTVRDLRMARMQGDSFILEIARAMGLEVDVLGDDIRVTRRPGSELRPVDIDLRDASDLVPAVVTACTAIRGTSMLRGIGFIRTKESDRLGDLAAELNAAGARVIEHDDALEVRGGQLPTAPHEFCTHHDHRLAMAFAMVAAGGGTAAIDDDSVVSKSWPGYFSDMSGLLGRTQLLK